MENMQPSHAQKAFNYFKQNVEWIKRAIQNPSEAFSELPTQGNFDELTHTTALMSLISGVVSAAYMLTLSPEFAIGIFTSTAISAWIYLAISTCVINYGSMLFGKEPGLYKTAHFVCRWSLIMPISFLAGHFQMLLTLPMGCLWVYQMYCYVQSEGHVTKKTAQIIFGILTGVGLLGIISMSATVSTVKKYHPELLRELSRTEEDVESQKMLEKYMKMALPENQ